MSTSQLPERPSALNSNAGLQSVAITGATGVVGRNLARSLAARGVTVNSVVRRKRDASTQERSGNSSKEILWDPAKGTIDAGALEGVDAVVHLAGENIADGRWTAAKKDRIRRSRVDGTTLLATTLAKLDRPPKVLVSASAIGFYGDRGDAILSEDSLPGSGFLPDVCVAWEQATRPAADAGIRVVNLRIGVVLTREGGALKQMLLPFQLGLGGRLGHGGQYFSWITLPDLVGAIEHSLDRASLRGPVNGVAPSAVTNAEFTATLGRVLRRPTLFPVPRFAARLLLGEMADALLMASARVAPIRLIESGYEFQHPTLEAALRAIL